MFKMTERLLQQQAKYGVLLELFAERLFLAVHPGGSWTEDAIPEVFLPFAGYVLESAFPDGVQTDSVVDDEVIRRTATAVYMYLMPGEDLDASDFKGNIYDVARDALKIALRESRTSSAR